MTVAMDVMNVNHVSLTRSRIRKLSVDFIINEGSLIEKSLLSSTKQNL